MQASQSTAAREISFARDGAQCFRSVLDTDVLDDIEAILSDLPSEQAGIRLTGIAGLKPPLSIDGAIGAIARSTLGDRARPVRAILFDKTARMNWRLAWHQDRTIVVKRRIDVEGYGPWSIKAGLQHVAPPFFLLAEMLTLRVHLDDVSFDNAPLMIAPGSHRFGRVAEADIKAAVQRCGTVACLAAAGDIWLYTTPILHASDAAAVPSRRRVLQNRLFRT
jgi:Phytanoyl-CoA dioxygenase (PhyH)